MRGGTVPVNGYNSLQLPPPLNPFGVSTSGSKGEDSNWYLRNVNA